MAGKAVPKVKNRAANFERIRHVIVAPGTTDFIIPCASEVPMLIHAIYVGIDVLGGTDYAVQFFRRTPAQTIAQAISAAEDITGVIDLENGAIATGEFEKQAFSLTSSVPDNNILNPGEDIVGDLSGTAGSASNLTILVLLRPVEEQ